MAAFSTVPRVLKVSRDAGRPERVAGGGGGESRFKRPALHHSQHVRARHRIRRQPPPVIGRQRSSRALRGAGQSLLDGVDEGRAGPRWEFTFWSVNGQKLTDYQITAGVGPVQTGINYYFGGQLIKNNNGRVSSDRLGSNGKFYPYGQERPSATTNGTEKFTGYFRDAEISGICRRGWADS
jgi:hypothetical protein